MKIFVYISILLALAGNAYGDCNCLEPFYQDKIDLLTRYTACLERCFVSKINALEIQLDRAESRTSELEADVERLKERIKRLEDRISNN